METLNFSTEKELKIEDISETKVEKDRIDDKKPREYYTILFSDAANPLKAHRTRNFFQRHTPDGLDAVWRGGNPVDAKAMKGSKIRGEIMKVPVAPYEIVDANGIVRQVDNFTIVIFDGENVAEVVRNYGHILAGQLNSISIYDTQTGNMGSTDQQREQSRINSRENRLSDKPSSERPLYEQGGEFNVQPAPKAGESDKPLI